MHIRHSVSALLFSSLFTAAAANAFSAPSTVEAGITTLPNGRRISPVGNSIQLAPFPFTMALSPDGKQIVAPSVGWPFSLNIVDSTFLRATNVPGRPARRLPSGHESSAEVQVLAGVVYSPDGRLLYDATGNSGSVDVYATADWRRVARISMDGTDGVRAYKESLAGSLALSPGGDRLYVVDQANWRIAVIDTKARALIASVPTGVNPLAVKLSPDGTRLYVTNSGLFEYSLIQSVDPNKDDQAGLRFPPTGYPSRAAREGVTSEGYKIAGLGDENSVRGSSLWTYSIGKGGLPRLVSQLRLGDRITEQAHGVVGGASPSSIAADDKHVYVSLDHEDAVAEITADGARIESQIPLSPFAVSEVHDAQGRPLRGVGPLGMAIHGDRLYVAESGINAVAVVDTHNGKVLGHVPAGWYPADVAVSRDGSMLYILNNKGKGAGPNWLHGKRTYIGELEYGTLSALPLNGLDAELPRYTPKVIEDNSAAESPETALAKTPIQHVFLIIRENRTFDEVLGDLPGVDGAPKLARYGVHGWAVENPSLRNLRVTPNAHALAARFATSDRFSTDSDVSADGHRWAVGIAPTLWMNMAWTSGYGGRRTSNVRSAAPGRRAISGGADAPMPEDEPEFGSMWEHVADAKLTLLNYGEGLEVEGSDERAGAEPEGQRLHLNSPVPKPVFDATDRQFPTFNLGIPDQLRFEEFARDFPRRVAAGLNPALTVIRLPGDHTASPRPGDGYRYKASYVADNDLALGKIVDLISHSALWKTSAIFVIEDDAQDGADHFDAHRSVVLAISPYVKRGYVSHTRTSMTGVQKTIYELLGVGALNLEDGLAAGLGDMFTDAPDFTPFQSVPSDVRVFDPAKARIATPKNAKEARELLDCDDPVEIEAEFRRRAGGR